jgi:hypothetical protein
VGRVGPVSVSIVVCVPSLPILSQCAQADSCFPPQYRSSFSLPCTTFAFLRPRGDEREKAGRKKHKPEQSITLSARPPSTPFFSTFQAATSRTSAAVVRHSSGPRLGVRVLDEFGARVPLLLRLDVAPTSAHRSRPKSLPRRRQ